MAWDSTGTSVATSKTASVTTLYSGGGQVVKQCEVITTTEIRGLTEDAAKDMATASTATDNSTRATYWARINGRTVSVEVITGGTKTDKAAARRDESGQWVVATTVHDYSASGLTSGVWGTTELAQDGTAVSISQNGTEVTVSVDKSISRVAWDVYSVLTTTVKEYRYIDTEAHANALVSALAATSEGTTTVNYNQTINGNSMVSAWVVVPSGSSTTASARNSGGSEGWIVTTNTRSYSWTSPRAAASGDGWR